jgi:hypothetical protein
MATMTVEGFSISHAGILNGSTGAELQAIYGVREGQISVNISNYDNTGDDVVLSTWFWFDYATVSITAGYVPFSTIALLTGATITSSGTAPADYYNLPLWNYSSLNQPRRPMLLRIPSKDSAGVTRTLDIILYSVQFEPINFQGPAYKSGLILNYAGRSLPSLVDEVGNALTEKTIGRLISHP